MFKCFLQLRHKYLILIAQQNNGAGLQSSINSTLCYRSSWVNSTVCVRPDFHNDPKISVSFHRLQWDFKLSLLKKRKKGESEVILCGQGIWINSYSLTASKWNLLKFMQLICRAFNKICKRMLPGLCGTTLAFKKKETSPENTCWYFHKKKIFFCASHVLAN